MECYRVNVPEGVLLAGYTAGGRQARIPAGEYHVHRFVSCAGLRGLGDALRFVGADGCDRDVHVPLAPGDDVRAVLPREVTTQRDGQ
jgi:hypothetical protein